jgi:transcriptional regulator with XRE-family HTH domain
MNIKNRKTSQNAKVLLERLNGGPLTFGQLIESIRKCDEISQAELAKQMGISKQNLCDLEKGRKTASVERAIKFAQALNYPVPMFVGTLLEEQVRKAGLKIKIKMEAA